MAFRECNCLRDFRPNGGVRLGYLCLLGTGVAGPGLRRTYLGTVWDPRELHLPQGLEAVGDAWFVGSGLERLVVSNSVRGLGTLAFSDCEQLHEVVFAADSRLERIGDECFSHCGLLGVAVPRGVRTIGRLAFYDCRELSSLRFEAGSLLQRVGREAFGRTPLGPEQLAFPNGVEEDAEEDQ